ncbi:MAG TPA: AsnC family protein, partial [Micrococcaceae bacterium]
MSTAKNIRRETAAPVRNPEPLDAIDRQIIDALVADARITNRDLADAVGIAPSTALMR